MDILRAEYRIHACIINSELTRAIFILTDNIQLIQPLSDQNLVFFVEYALL